MSSYKLYFSDPSKSSVPIIVNDGSANSESTSLTLIGKDYPGYGQAIGENLIHLLENFASGIPPKNSIEGQLWFDTSDPLNKKLRINDGGINSTSWVPINGVYQQDTEPTSSKKGDIWVDTLNQQLKFYNGAAYITVGPNVASSSRTGSYPEVLIDTNGDEHNVIIQYVNDVPIEIISSEDFIPNPIIDGFTNIETGINISSANFGSNLQPNISKINGIADAALYLQLSGSGSARVIADSFMRKDIDQRMTGSLNIGQDSNALRIGDIPTFILERRNQFNSVFVNTYENGRFTFEISGSNRPLFTIDGETRTVNVLDPLIETPTSGMIVNGFVRSSSSGTFSTVYSTSTVFSPVFRSNSNSLAQFVGIATTATSLQNSSQFSLTGEISATAVSFNGTGSSVVLTTIGTVGLINNRNALSVSTASDFILVSQAGTLYKQTKKNFFKDVNYQEGTDPLVNPGYTTPAGSLVPLGTIVLHSGNTAPPGWLICDGSAIGLDSKYQNLKDLIGTKYDQANTSYLLPDLTNQVFAGVVPVNYIIKY